MRLKEIKIENFGRLAGYNRVFSSGLNVINEENGWGKSTLAAFIKVMFYGFEGAKKHNDIENERRKYKPWQGGTYGGSVVFEADGREYKLIRIFGQRDAEDEFKLYDNKTGLKSEDYSENIGEQLFKLDSDSFKRTVLINQNDIETESTDGINAKLGNLSEATDDINSYEKVSKILKDKLNAISSSKSTGYIYRLKNEITGLEETIKQIADVEASVSEKQKTENALKSKIENNRETAAKLSEELKKASRSAELSSKRNQYNGILERYIERESDQRKANADLPCGMPTDEELQKQITLAKQINEDELDAALYRLDAEEISVLNKYNESFSSLEPEIINGLIYDITEAKSKRDALTSKETLLQSLKAQNRQRKESPVWIILLILGVLIGAAGLFITSTIRVAVVCIGIIIIIAGIILKIAGRNNSKNTEGYSDLEQLESEIRSDREIVDTTSKKAEGFLKDYGYEFNYSDALPILGDIKNDYKRYASLIQKQQYYKAKKDSIEKDKAEIRRFIGSYSNAADDSDLMAGLAGIKRAKDILMNANEELDKVLDEKKAFEQDNDIDVIMSVTITEETGDVDEINEKLISLNSENEILNDDIGNINSQISAGLEELDGLNEKREELIIKKEEYDHLRKREILIGKTRELLDKAKTDFVARYSEPVTTGFRKYYELLDGTGGKEYSFDADMNLMIEDHGSYKNIHSYSAGSRDKINLCFRMGLIEAMYTDEKPFIILDDPFTNMDEKHLEGGKKILDMMQKNYQIIYMTCHESRVP